MLCLCDLLLFVIVPANQLHVTVDARGSKSIHVSWRACMWGKATLGMYLLLRAVCVRLWPEFGIWAHPGSVL